MLMSTERQLRIVLMLAGKPMTVSKIYQELRDDRECAAALRVIQRDIHDLRKLGIVQVVRKQSDGGAVYNCTAIHDALAA